MINKTIKCHAFALFGILIVITLSTVCFASSDWDPDSVVSMMKLAMGDSFSEFDNNLSFYNDNTIRFIVDMDASKDYALSNKSQLYDQWSTLRDNLTGVSQSGYDVLKTLGCGDKFFVVTVLDNVYDEASDVWLIVVNGNVVYDMYN